MFDYYDTLITPEEVADMLGCGMNTTYKLLKSGKIKAMRIGRVWKIPKRAVQEYISIYSSTHSSNEKRNKRYVFK